MQDPSSLAKLEILPANPLFLRMAGFQAPIDGWFSAPADSNSAPLLQAFQDSEVPPVAFACVSESMGGRSILLSEITPRDVRWWAVPERTSVEESRAP